MPGITIIDTIKIYEAAWWQVMLSLIPLIIGAVFYFVKWYIAFKKGTPEERARRVVSTNNYTINDFCKSILALIVGGILAVILTVCSSNVWPTQYVETRYEVSIDKAVSFVDFYENYTIIAKTNDNTFIVKEK